MEEEWAEATIPQGATMKSGTHKILLWKTREGGEREHVTCGVRDRKGKEGGGDAWSFTNISESEGEAKPEPGGCDVKKID